MLGTILLDIPVNDIMQVLGMATSLLENLDMKPFILAGLIVVILGGFVAYFRRS